MNKLLIYAYFFECFGWRAQQQQINFIDFIDEIVYMLFDASSNSNRNEWKRKTDKTNILYC